MSRSLIALIAGIAGFFVYIVVALAIADIVLTMHWAVQAIYFVAAALPGCATSRPRRGV
jgi:hypothetical protein